MTTIQRLGIVAGALALLLIALLTHRLRSAANIAQLSTTPPTSMPTPEESVARVFDADTVVCNSYGEILGLAWNDRNGDGLRQVGEHPLKGIKFHLVDQNGRIASSVRFTDEDGIAIFTDFRLDCPSVDQVIYPDVRLGYELTTAAAIRAVADNLDEPVEFGFRPSPQEIDVTTIQPRGLRCTRQLGSAVFYRDLYIGPDDAVWVAGPGHAVYRYDPADYSHASTLSPEETSAFDDVSVVGVAPDGSVWMGAGSEIFRFDGSTWTTFAITGRVHNIFAGDIDIGHDGRIWFTLGDGAASFDPQTGLWIPIEPPGFLDLVFSVTVANDGSVWFGTQYGAYRLTTPNNEPYWTIYSGGGRHRTDAAGRIKGHNVDLHSVRGIVEDANGTMWLASDALVKLDAETGEYKKYYLGGGVIDGVAAAPDGSIWVGTHDEIYQFFPARENGTEDIWYGYGEEVGIAPGILEMAVTSQNVVWIASVGGMSYCYNPQWQMP